MNPVVHFEMPYEDAARAADFYGKVFGWKSNILGPDMGNYVTVHTAKTDEHNMVQRPGAINGGLFKRSKPDQGPSVVIAVEDIRVAMEKVKAAGGKILGGMGGPDAPDDIPGIGLYCGFIDSEGNRVSMLQPKGM